MTEIVLFPKILKFFQYKKPLTNLIKESYLIEKKYNLGGNNWYDSNKIYNTCGTYNLYNNKKFKNILLWIETCVKEYCDRLQIYSNIYEKNAWLNIYKKHQGQEYHDHHVYDISAIFFLKGSINSAKVLFTDFNEKSKLPVKNFIDVNSTVWKVSFTEGTLIVFRSDLIHSVEQHMVDEDRISISLLTEDFGHWRDKQVPNTYSHYADTAMETLLLSVQPTLEKIVKHKLVPNYSYARIYKQGDVLERHKDRYSCEISVTLNLGGDPWPIFIDKTGKENQKGNKVTLKQGDMLVYKGQELEHWRDPFVGQDCVQVFLHYNKHNKNNNNIFDGRLHVGLPSWFRK